jgi:ABC-type sugar transport system ATPase subunit
MEDVVAVADRVIVLKAGRKVAEALTQALTPQALAQAVMSGAFDPASLPGIQAAN